MILVDGEFYTVKRGQGRRSGRTARAVMDLDGSSRRVDLDFNCADIYISFLGCEHKFRKATAAEITAWIGERE